MRTISHTLSNSTKYYLYKHRQVGFFILKNRYTYRSILVCESTAQRGDKHLVYFLAFFFEVDDVSDSIFELIYVLLVQGLLFVEFALCLSKFELERIELVGLLFLLFYKERIVGNLVFLVDVGVVGAVIRALRLGSLLVELRC